MRSVFRVFRYHITASGCELARKLVQAGSVSDTADCPVEPVKTDAKRTDRVKQNVPSTSQRQFPDHELPAASTAASGAFTDDFAVVLDEDNEWQNEFGFVLPEQTQSHQSW